MTANDPVRTGSDPCRPPLRLLTFTTLYPHAGAPDFGVFVENRLRHLVATGQATSLIVAPVPWVPPLGTLNPAWASWAGALPAEQRYGLTVRHPRYLAIPKIGMNVAPWLLYEASRRAIARHMRQTGQRFDMIDAHYAYPDGVAATWLGRRLGLPVVITARGSDVTEYPAFPMPRRLIRRAFADAAAIITVSAGLRDAVVALGTDGNKVRVLRNGVDLASFRPAGDRAATRAELGMGGPTLLSVGHLIERKGHDLAIEALTQLPGWRLMIVGSGPAQGSLQGLATRLGVSDRVSMVGQVPHASLRRYYAAADMLVLASKREGWANVLLESMACGTPVIASPIPGNPEVVQERAAGLVMAERSGCGVADAVRDLASDPPDRDATRAYAERFSWTETTKGQLDLFETVAGPRRPAHEGGGRTAS